MRAGPCGGWDGVASVVDLRRRAPAPIFARCRRGVMLRSNLMGGAEMDFCHFPQCLWSLRFDSLSGSLFHAGRHTALQSDTEFFALAFEPIDESFPRDNRGRRHCDIGFRSRTLLEDNVASMSHQGFLDYARVCKLIRQRSRTARLLRQQILDNPRMSPSEKPVQIAKFFV